LKEEAGRQGQPSETWAVKLGRLMVGVCTTVEMNKKKFACHADPTSGQSEAAEDVGSRGSMLPRQQSRGT